jgi:hypothetical protein
MTKAQQARMTALGMLTELYFPESRDYQLTFPHFGGWSSNNLGMQGNIEKLRSIGRTQRWQDALTRWQKMIGEQTTPQGLRWAYFQGAVYAGHAL